MPLKPSKSMSLRWEKLSGQTSQVFKWFGLENWFLEISLRLQSGIKSLPTLDWLRSSRLLFESISPFWQESQSQSLSTAILSLTLEQSIKTRRTSVSPEQTLLLEKQEESLLELDWTLPLERLGQRWQKRRRWRRLCNRSWMSLENNCPKSSPSFVSLSGPLILDTSMTLLMEVLGLKELSTTSRLQLLWLSLLSLKDFLLSLQHVLLSELEGWQRRMLSSGLFLPLKPLDVLLLSALIRLEPWLLIKCLSADSFSSKMQRLQTSWSLKWLDQHTNQLEMSS